MSDTQQKGKSGSHYVIQVENKEDFDKRLKSAGDKLVVVDFFADWCGPCKMISPKLERMAEELKEAVTFLKLNVDEAEDIAEHYEVNAMPTFKLIKNEKVVDTFVGANDIKLRETIDKCK